MKKAIFIFTLLLLVGAVYTSSHAASLGSTLSGLILLQVEENGEAWYVYPDNQQRYFLGRPNDAFSIMRSLGLGIKHDELTNYLNSSFPSRLSGLILLDVEENGEAYYVYPRSLRGNYLGRPADAFEVMRNLGLGITNADLSTITVSGDSSEVIDDTTSTTPTPSVASSVVVDTNQTKCYNNANEITCPSVGASFYGQDAQYVGTQPSYTNNGNGTVTDNNTGLTWIQDPGDKKSYTSAISDADSLVYGGYSDWRTPSIKELYSLMDFSGQDLSPDDTDASNQNPFINDDVFVFEYGDVSAGERIIDSQWVTTTTYVSKVMTNNDCFFGVNFADGRIKCYPSSGPNDYFVRYVRGDAYGVNDFVNNGDGTITDRSSGLQWQQNDSGSGMDWEDALAYCENLSFANYTDWRLPDAKELQYIVDYSRSPDATNSPAIDPIFNTTSITNEGGSKDYPFFWTGTTHDSRQGGGSAVYVSFGRALGFFNNQWVDVHGAGAQRSDPKSGNANDFPSSFGPQGDVLRLFNYARCVRDTQ